MKRFIFTCGDTNGIGPEIVIKALNKLTAQHSYHFLFICPENIFKENIKIVKPEFDYEIVNKSKKFSEQVSVINIKKRKLEWGKPTKNSGLAAFEAIKLSFDLLKDKKADAVITAPISKTAINLAGYDYPGHTEMYAGWSKAKDYVMMFLSKNMNAALITIHEPLKTVSKLLSVENLNLKIEIVVQTLINDLRINKPKIAVLGLNPHAGEDGLIGKEEKKIIKPAIGKSKYKEYLSGPFSPDAFFGSRGYNNYDMIIGMYHDQILIPFKLLNFSSGVNYTAGLPFVRTSPDHGVAYDIAGKNMADESSLTEAFYAAEKIVNNRKLNAV